MKVSISDILRLCDGSAEFGTIRDDVFEAAFQGDSGVTGEFRDFVVEGGEEGGHSANPLMRVREMA